MEILVHRAEFVPGAVGAAVRAQAAGLRGHRLRAQAHVRPRRVAALAVLLSPLLLACALAIKLTSRGPVIYRSMRPGHRRRALRVLQVPHDVRATPTTHQAELEAHNEATGALFKIRDDPRVTPVGRFLRRFSIDELPQLFNVLRGEMSLVGPRPLPQRDYERLEDWHKKRYLVLPGITGLWQVSGRSELDFDDLVRLDFLYLERWSVVPRPLDPGQDRARRAVAARSVLRHVTARTPSSCCRDRPPSGRQALRPACAGPARRRPRAGGGRGGRRAGRQRRGQVDPPAARGRDLGSVARARRAGAGAADRIRP